MQIDRERAARLGVALPGIDATLYDAFGQRQVATMFSALNQYAVVLEWAPEHARVPQALHDVMLPVAPAVSARLAGQAAPVASATSANPAQRGATTGQPISFPPAGMVPLPAFAEFSERAVPTSVWHDGGELSSTLSFDLADGVSIEQGRQAVLDAVDAVGLPNNVRGVFSGAAAQAQQTQAQQVLLIGAAIVVIYIVLGILYESLIHPVTVLTTLPSAGFGAALSLLALKMEFSIMALIGVFLLIGIVKKNAILIIDFALDAERARPRAPRRRCAKPACCASPDPDDHPGRRLGALPLAIGFGQGDELRQPLGVTIVGGLIASQLLTLLTTPVVYVLLDRLRRRRPDQAHLARGVVAAPGADTT